MPLSDGDKSYLHENETKCTFFPNPVVVTRFELGKRESYRMDATLMDVSISATLSGFN